MEIIKVTIEIPAERLEAHQEFLTVTKEKVMKEEPVPVPETPAVVAEEPKKKKVTVSDLRAKGVELTKAGKRDELKAVFEKYGAKNLGTLTEEHYASALEDMEALL